MGSVRVSPNAAAWVLGVAIGIGILAGCNIFSPLAADNGNDLTYRGLILKGNQAINDRQYAAAADYFARAKALNPRGSEAYLYHSKALISLYSIDYNELNTEFECRRPSRDSNLCKSKGIDTSGVPFIDSATTVKGVDSVYYPVATAVRNLEHILRKGKDTIPLGGSWKMYPDGDTAADGKISDGVARLDLGILQAVKAMLAPLDLDGNDRIDEICGTNICPDRTNGACLASAAYASKCKEGDSSEVKRLASFKKLTRRVSLDNLDSKDVNARNVSTNPNDINAFLDAMQGPVAGSNYNLDSVTGAMESHNEQKMSDQLSGIVDNINDLNNFLSYMRYNDSMDNDLDSRKGVPGRDDIMIWHDFDKDGGIRYDYDEDALLVGYPPGSGDIGHPMHRHLRKDLYQTYAEWNTRYPVIEGDASKNSRRALMRKKCRDVVNDWPETGRVTGLLKAEVLATCSTHTSLLKPSAPRPSRSDWVGGTPGVDEEMVDERDNDYDGLKDEDARNARRQDDDDDALLTLGMIGNPSMVQPMAWADAPGSGNKCPDIKADSMPAAPFQRQFCIGSLEHRIWLAQNGGEDTLALYYSRFLVGVEGGPHANCLEDFEKLPEKYRTDANLKVTDRAVRTACMFKHIWIHGIPAGSEWTSGVFGVDEEVLDGVDNDGDGWIDEDLK